MHLALTFGLVAALTAFAQDSKPSAAPTPAPDKAKETEAEVGFGAVRTPSLVTRVGGDREIAIEVKEGVYRCGKSSIESPLPDGYPEPTPPGAIDLKEFPSVRRVEWASNATAGQRSMDGGFWPLFNHIKSRDIPMTSPVEMDYPGVFPEPLTSTKPVAKGAWTMSFLYRNPSEGPTGTDGSLKVVDTPAVTMLAVGVQGPYGMAIVEKGLTALQGWLAEHPEYELAGSVRVFHYNGPYVRDAYKWSEVQLPVRKKVTPEAAAAPTGASEKPAQQDAELRR